MGKYNFVLEKQWYLCICKSLVLLQIKVITPKREGELTASAYLMTQATYSTNLVTRLNVITYTTMCRVQCAMLPPGEQC